METREQLIARMQNQIAFVLDPLIQGGAITLVDFPDHSNVGDSAIWLGEIAYFQSRKIEINYVSTHANCSLDAIRAHAGDKGAIFIHGGGNFGDIWPRHQEFREKIIREFPNNKIIQFPQTVYFSNDEAAARSAKIINKHRDFILLARDQRSLDYSKTHFDCQTVACPDMAFCIGEMKQVGQEHRTNAPLLLLRVDKESRSDLLSILPQSFIPSDGKSVDWLVEPKGTRSTARAIAVIEWLLFYLSSGIRRSPREIYYTRLAQRRLQRGIRLLCSRERVVSDRLHVHIISTLLGVPHIVLDNNYGKIQGYMDTWQTKWEGVDTLHLEVSPRSQSV